MQYQHYAYQLKAVNKICVSLNADAGQSRTLMIWCSNDSFCRYNNTVACWDKPAASLPARQDD